MADQTESSTERFSRWAKDLAGMIVLAAIYAAVARVSLAAATEHRVVSSIWPPAGIALFALLRYGPRFWPGVVLGAYVLNASNGVGAAASLVIAVGNMLEAVVGAHLVGQVMGRRRALSRVRDVLAVAVLAGTLSTIIAASIGVGALVLSGGTTLDLAPGLWLVWWTGDAVGVLVVTPLLLVWTVPELKLPGDRWRWAEAGALFAALAVVTDYVFSRTGLFAFAVFPLALVVSWRLGPRGAATASAVVTLIASWHTLSGYGPFTTQTPTTNLFTLQFFLGLLAIENLAFAAASAESIYGQARVRADELRYRTLAQKLPDSCVALFDRTLKILLVEGPALEAAGLTKAGVEGRRLGEIFDAEAAAALGGPFLAAINGADVEFEVSRNERAYLVRVLALEDAEAGTTIGMALVLDITEREAAQRQIAENRAQLERLSRLLLTAQEDERKRVAREVHDELGQALTAVKIGLAQTMSRAQRRNSLESELRVQNAADILDRAIETVQRIVLRLRPGVLDHLGLLAALEHEVQQFRAQSSLEVTLTLPPETVTIGAEQSTVLYRTVQESFTNVLRHARAQHVSVTLLLLDHDLVLQITDDGVGIPEEQMRRPRSMGLLGMRERAANCGGYLEVARVDTGGTCVMLRVPHSANGGI